MTAVQQERSSTNPRQRRRRLTQEEQREIARLYAEPNASAHDIRERYGIGDSTLYRVLSRFGVSRRGSVRTASTSSSDATTLGREDRQTNPARAKRSGSRVSTSRHSGVAGRSQRFRVLYKVERVVSALGRLHWALVR